MCEPESGEAKMTQHTVVPNVAYTYLQTCQHIYMHMDDSPRKRVRKLAAINI